MASLDYLGEGGGERGNMSSTYAKDLTSDEVTTDMFEILEDQRRYLKIELPAKVPRQDDVLSAKQMAYMFNMYSWLQSTPDIQDDEQWQIHNEFSLGPTEEAEAGAGGGAGLDTPKGKGIQRQVTHRALKLSPASSAILSRYEAKLVRLLRGGLLKQDEVAAFGDFTKESIPKVEYESTVSGSEYTPKQIGDALRIDELPASQKDGRDIPTITSKPEVLHVIIGGNAYSLKISGIWQGQRLYPQIMLHHAEKVASHPNPEWHVKMYQIDREKMYVEQLYYGTELGAQLGKRISAKQLFKFIADMGYTKVTLDDASSVQFLMPYISGPVFRHAAEPGGYSYEFVDIRAEKLNQTQNYFRSLSMNLVNAVKHVVLSDRQTIRVYSAAAASVRDQAGAVAAEIEEEPLEQAVKDEVGAAQGNQREEFEQFAQEAKLEQDEGAETAMTTESPLKIIIDHAFGAPMRVKRHAHRDAVAAAAAGGGGGDPVHGTPAAMPTEQRAAQAAHRAAAAAVAAAGGGEIRAREAEAARTAGRAAGRHERGEAEAREEGRLHTSFFRLKF